MKDQFIACLGQTWIYKFIFPVQGSEAKTMPCIGHVIQEYPLQAYSIDSNTNFIETSYQKTSCTKPKLRSIVYRLCDANDWKRFTSNRRRFDNGISVCKLDYRNWNLLSYIKLSLHTNQVAHQAGACPCKWLGEVLLPPGWDASL